MKFRIKAYLAIVAWAVSAALVLLFAPRTHNPTNCQELAQPEQDDCKTRRKL
jgi:hypothetical protein